MGNSAIKSVREALRNFVKFPEGTSNGNVTLIEKMYDEKTKDECLKICGQKILQIGTLKKSQNLIMKCGIFYLVVGMMVFHIWMNLLKQITIGVGWDKIRDISNLSDLEIEKTL